VLNVSLSDKTWGAILARLVAPKAYRITISRDKHEKYEKLYSRVGVRPPLHPPTPFSEQNILALRTAIDFGSEPVDAAPSIAVDEKVLAELRDYTTRYLSAKGKSRFAVLNTDAAQAFREWGYDNSLALTKELERQTEDLAVLWTSAPNRSHLSQNFLAEHGEAERYMATPSVRHLAAAIHDSCLVISPDTSVIHFAVALGKPVVGLYFERSEFSPYTKQSVVLVPPKGGMVKDIPLSDALEASLKLLTA
jgi:ADP-heptose:LPS heptosyltransferase